MVLKGRQRTLCRVSIPDLTRQFGESARHGIASQEQGENRALNREQPQGITPLRIRLHRKVLPFGAGRGAVSAAPPPFLVSWMSGS